MKTLVVCADDYGLNDEVSLGVIDLLTSRRLSATTVMVTAPDIETKAAWLLPFQDQIDMGLHFDLTEFSSFTFREVLKRSLLHRLNKEQLKNELRAQLGKFSQLFSKRPDFIDGHEHVHQLPTVRSALVELLSEDPSLKGIKIRCSYDRASKIMRKNISPLKTLGIAFMGARLKKLAHRHQIVTNSALIGIYNFKTEMPYETLFMRSIEGAEPKSIFMCHPARLAANTNDPITQQRFREYQFFYGKDFQNLLESGFLALARW